MLFKFLGNSDVPDWLMSELNTLSFVSSVRIKFILIQIYNLLTEAEVNWDAIYHHLTDAKLTDSQVRTVVAVLSFIVQNAVRFDVDAEDLAQELQQLGAPLSHTSTIIRFYRENRRALRKYFRGNYQRITESPVFEYRSDIVLKRRDGEDFPQGRVYLRFSPKNADLLTVAMSARQAEDLARELRAAIEVMNSMR
jgi:hypothetical protein